MKNMLNILVHGAVNGSNFGDCLYAIIYEYFLKQNGYNVFFWNDRQYGISHFLERNTDCSYTDSLKDIDLFVYMPGGYLTELSNDPEKAARRYKKYIEIGEAALKANKAVAVSGVGDGTICDSKLNDAVCSILRQSVSVTFRSEETADYFSQYIENRYPAAADPIFMTRHLPLPQLPENLLKCLQTCEAKHETKLLLHVYGRNNRNEQLLKKIIPAVNRYAESHNVHVFLVTDYRMKPGQSIRWTKLYRALHAKKTVLAYESPLQLCAILKHMDCVVTEKLHVGVISGMFNKSVISFPINPIKTRRFYELIGQPDRSVLMEACTPAIALEKLEQYVDQPIRIPEQVLNDSERHMDALLACTANLQQIVPAKNSL